MSGSAQLCVAVSGIHLGENAQPGAGVVRSLREALGERCTALGIGYDAFDSGLHAPGMLARGFLFPYPSAGPRAWLERLAQVHAEQPIDVLIPCLDVELPLLVRQRHELEKLGIKTVLPSARALARRAKDQLPELAERTGIAVPQTLRVGDLASLDAAGAQLSYPLVVKGPFYEAEVARSPAEARAAYMRLSARWGLPLLAQRFVEGVEFDVIALGDGQGGTLGAVAMRKTVVTKMGKAWGAITVADEELLRAARRLVAELGWHGGCEVELLRDARGQLHLIEFNPRFPAWVYLATAAGQNLPLALLRMALGEAVEPLTDYRAGVFYVRHAVEALGDESSLETLLTSGCTKGAGRE